MNCHWIEDFENGRIGEESFQKHINSCAHCKKYANDNSELIKLAKSLKEEINAPLLWNRIENALRKENQKMQIRTKRQFWVRAYPALRFAAVIILLFSAGTFIWYQFGISQENILADSALKRVEKQEAAYIQAIENLEKKSIPKMEEMDLELALLYRDRLETIDAQITRCQEALDENPANAHIRRYMLAALQDKKETLKEILRS